MRNVFIICFTTLVISFFGFYISCQNMRECQKQREEIRKELSEIKTLKNFLMNYKPVQCCKSKDLKEPLK